MQSSASQSPEKPACPKCGNRLRVLADQAGTEVRCPKCNAKFVLGGKPKPTSQPKPRGGPKRPQQSAKPIEAPSRSATPDQKTAEPALDESYLPEIPVKRSTIVPEEQERLPKQRPAIVPDEPKPLPADDESAPMLPERELSQETPYASEQSEYEVDWSTVDEADAVEMETPAAASTAHEDVHLEQARERGLVRDYAVEDPPRWTLLSGVFDYPWRGVNLSRWTTMSFGLSIAGVLTMAAMRMLGLLGGLTVMAVPGVFVGMFAVVMTLVSMSFAVACCQAAIQDTANGHNEPQDDALPDWTQCILTFLVWLCMWAASGSIGLPLSLLIGPAACLIFAMLLFPVLLLSALETTSYLFPFSPPVLRSLGSCFSGWLMFYLLSGGMLAGWVIGFDLLAAQMPYVSAFLSGPVLAAMILVYGRLLGRVAWRAAGAPVAAVERAEPSRGRAAADDAGARSDAVESALAKRRRKKRRYRQIDVPEDIETPPRGDPPPRINFHLRP